MAHFAEIDSNNKVLRVLVVDNSQEHRGQEFLANDCDLGGTWIQTSYNENIRGKFGGIGDIYDPVNDRFISKQPYPSWLLDADFNWQAPVARPTDGKSYNWNEDTKSWDEIVID
jgi:hypothetical protein